MIMVIPVPGTAKYTNDPVKYDLDCNNIKSRYIIARTQRSSAFHTIS